MSFSICIRSTNSCSLPFPPATFCLIHGVRWPVVTICIQCIDSETSTSRHTHTYICICIYMLAPASFSLAGSEHVGFLAPFFSVYRESRHGKEKRTCYRRVECDSLNYLRKLFPTQEGQGVLPSILFKLFLSAEVAGSCGSMMILTGIGQAYRGEIKWLPVCIKNIQYHSVDNCMPRLGVQCTWDSAYCFNHLLNFLLQHSQINRDNSTTMLPVTRKRKIRMMNTKNWNSSHPRQDCLPNLLTCVHQVTLITDNVLLGRGEYDDEERCN